MLDQAGGIALRFARAQILRLDAAVQRRYSRRFGALPFPLYIASLPDTTDELSTSIFQAALGTPEEDRGVYARILLKRFPTVEQLKSLKLEKAFTSEHKAQIMDATVATKFCPDHADAILAVLEDSPLRARRKGQDFTAWRA